MRAGMNRSYIKSICMRCGSDATKDLVYEPDASSWTVCTDRLCGFQLWHKLHFETEYWLEETRRWYKVPEGCLLIMQREAV